MLFTGGDGVRVESMHTWTGETEYGRTASKFPSFVSFNLLYTLYSLSVHIWMPAVSFLIL